MPPPLRVVARRSNQMRHCVARALFNEKIIQLRNNKIFTLSRCSILRINGGSL